MPSSPTSSLRAAVGIWKMAGKSPFQRLGMAQGHGAARGQPAPHHDGVNVSEVVLEQSLPRQRQLRGTHLYINHSCAPGGLHGGLSTGAEEGGARRAKALR